MSAPYFKDVPQPVELKGLPPTIPVAPIYGKLNDPLDVTPQSKDAQFVPESVRTGRIRTGTVGFVTAGIAGVNLVGADNKRVALSIFNAGTNRITVSDNPNVAIDQGINIAPSISGYTLTIETHGNLVTKRLTVIASAAGQNVGFIDTRFEPI